MDGIVLLNKDKGMTSSDAVIRLRHLLRTNRIGHTGTLDPMATGLLVCLVGRATKILPLIQQHRKSYKATVKLGLQTDTGDITGQITAEDKVPLLDETALTEALKGLAGPQMQLPPMYSAKKVNGRKLYEYARQNQSIERKPAAIEIFQMQLISYTADTVSFQTVCSSGTYVRVLCEQLASRLNTVGTMAELCRTSCGPFSIEHSQTLAQIQNGKVSLLGIAEALNDYPCIEVENISDVANGRDIVIPYDQPVVLISYRQEIMAVYQRSENGSYHCLRGLW